jgi:hypothetical protein
MAEKENNRLRIGELIAEVEYEKSQNVTLRAELSRLREENEHVADVAKRDGMQAIAQYERAQKAENENAKLRVDVIELREMLGNIMNTLEMNFTGIELRDILGRPELRKYRATLKGEQNGQEMS